MKKNQSSDGGAAVLDAPAVVTPASVKVDNHEVKLHRADHPGARCTYRIPGVAGVLVIPLSFFANGVAPSTLVLDVDLVTPGVDSKAAKEAATAAKLIEKAKKAKLKIEASALKAAERQAKADAALAAAKAKVAAASVTASTAAS